MGVEALSTNRERLVVEPVSDMQGMQEIERLQMAIWGSEPAWIVPSHVLYMVESSGGILLGAYLDGALVGFVLGFLGRKDGKLYHASHMLGIHPAYQHHGIGAALKWRQREHALAQGLDLMTWTFDPLESRNAYFNLHKLGALVRTYREDLYGPMDDDLNRGLPSDRLVVEWHLRDDLPRPSRSGSPQSILDDREGVPALRLDVPDGQPVAIHVPRQIQTIKRQNPEAALAWRLAARQAFSRVLSQGYVARDFVDGAYLLYPLEG